jgi:predicted glutamine amidotransferase
MCGLVGMMGTLEYKHKQAMRDLFFLNTLRGKDSTGLSSISRDKQVRTRKMTVPGYEFIEFPVVDKAMCHNDQLWIGHGRYKTTGEVSRANAHPFEVLDEDNLVMLVGAHNGTLTNKYELERELNDKYDTDSEALFNWLVEAPNYKDAIKKLRGAWSLVWWDPMMDKLHFCRNDERPMTYAFTKDGKVLVWASEAWMIINACRRNGVELAKNDAGLSCYATLPDNLYSFDIPQERDKVLPEFVREGGYVGQPTKTFQQAGWFHGKERWEDWWDDPNSPPSEQEREKQAAKAKKEGKADKPKSKDNVVTFGGIKGFEGKYITLAEFDAIKRKGCAWCKKNIPDKMTFAFLDEENLCCSVCIADKHPKGECLRRGEDELDDEIPFELTEKGNNVRQEDTAEYKHIIKAAAAKAVG